jgi:hydrogenase maturation protease
VGWHVAQTVERELAGTGASVEVDYLAVGGLTLMERLAGCRSAVLIDAITTGQQPPGSLYCLSLDDLPVLSAGHLHSAHDASLAVALRAGAALGVPLPQRLVIVGIEASRVYDFDESLSEPVAACVPLAARAVLDLLLQLDQEEGDL